MIGQFIYCWFGSENENPNFQIKEIDIISKLSKFTPKKWKYEKGKDFKSAIILQLKNGKILTTIETTIQIFNYNDQIEVEFETGQNMMPIRQVTELENGSLAVNTDTTSIWSLKGEKLMNLPNDMNIIWMEHRFKDTLILVELGKIFSWNLQTGQLKTLIDLGLKICFPVPEILFDGSIACGFENEPIYIMDKNGKIIQKINAHNLKFHGIKELKDTSICSWGDDNLVKIWNRFNGTCKLTLKGHSKNILNLKEKDDLIITSSKDGTAKIWKKDDGSCVKTFNTFEYGMSSYIFFEDQILGVPLVGFESSLNIWNFNGALLSSIKFKLPPLDIIQLNNGSIILKFINHIEIWK